MKKTDIAMIVFIASLSMVIAYFVANAIFGGASSETATVKTIESIDSSIVEPSPDIFNSNAINPAVEVQINGSATGSTTGQTQSDTTE
jgi:ABC-type cobalt transport system substrate-binding protein